MFTKENFKFDHVVEANGHKDYWFKTDTVSDDELTDKYMEQGMVGVTDVIYSKDEDFVGIKRLFPFSFDVITPDDRELKNILKELVKEM